LAGTVTAALLWPDGAQCRKAITLAHRMVGCTFSEPLYEPLLGSHLMHAAVYALVTEPRWLAGLEWDLLNLARDLYCLLAVGLAPDKLTFAVASAQGAANAAAHGAHGAHGHGGGSASPVGGLAGGIPAHHFAAVAGRPRAVLLRLPGVGPAQVAALDAALSTATDAKAQKDALRDLLRAASDAMHAQATTAQGGVMAGGVAGGGGALPAAESALRVRPPAILDLPQQMLVGAAGGGRRAAALAVGGDEALAGLAFLFDAAE
jgi:exportin-5